MPETTFWICDVCRQQITTPNDGWVEWISNPASTLENPLPGRDLRLVHHFGKRPGGGTCQFDGRAEHARDGGSIMDMSQESCMGPDGLMTLLSMLSENDLPQGQLLEMIKRLHIPGYELARLHINGAKNTGAYEQNTPDGYPYQYQIDNIIDWATREGLA